MTELTKETIDEIFENAKEQADYVIALYRVAFPNWDELASVGFPKASEETCQYIFLKAIEFDKRVHPDVMAGGAWLNNGFAYDKHMSDWEIDTTETEVTYKTPRVLPVVVKDVLPDGFFQDLSPVGVRRFLDWANTPANQSPEQLAKAGIYHPIVRGRWLELGLIQIGE